MLSSVTALQPAEWRFVTGPAGKPEVDPALGAQLRFSLSHTSGLVAASVSLDDHVGVDVEVLDPGNLPLDVAAFLSPDEITALRALPDRDRPAALFRVWTLKESYIKAIGTGLARDLRSIAFTLDPTGLGPGGEAPDDWQFFQFWPTPHHVLAVALHRRACEPATVVRRAVEHREL